MPVPCVDHARAFVSGKTIPFRVSLYVKKLPPPPPPQFSTNTTKNKFPVNSNSTGTGIPRGKGGGISVAELGT
jgi:hypothetical protein